MWCAHKHRSGQPVGQHPATPVSLPLPWLSWWAARLCWAAGSWPCGTGGRQGRGCAKRGSKGWAVKSTQQACHAPTRSRPTCMCGLAVANSKHQSQPPPQPCLIKHQQRRSGGALEPAHNLGQAAGGGHPARGRERVEVRREAGGNNLHAASIGAPNIQQAEDHTASRTLGTVCAPHADLVWPLPSQHGIRIVALGLLGAQARDEQLHGGGLGECE